MMIKVTVLKCIVLAKHICVHVFADYLEVALRNLKYNTPGLVTSLDVAKQHFGGNASPKRTASIAYEQTSSNSVPYSRRKGMQRFRTRIVSEFVSVDCTLLHAWHCIYLKENRLHI